MKCDFFQILASKLFFSLQNMQYSDTDLNNFLYILYLTYTVIYTIYIKIGFSYLDMKITPLLVTYPGTKFFGLQEPEIWNVTSFVTSELRNVILLNVTIVTIPLQIFLFSALTLNIK